MNKPQITASAEVYRDLLVQYNNAVADLNTSFGDAVAFAYYYDTDAEVLTTMQKNIEFATKRAEQVTRIAELGQALRECIADGYADEFRDYANAAYTWSRQNFIK